MGRKQWQWRPLDYTCIFDTSPIFHDRIESYRFTLIRWWSGRCTASFKGDSCMSCRAHAIFMSCFSPGKSRGSWPFQCEGQIHAKGQKTLVARLKTRIVFIRLRIKLLGWLGEDSIFILIAVDDQYLELQRLRLPLPTINFQVVTLRWRCNRRWHEGRSKAIEADESVAGEVCALFARWEKKKNEKMSNEMLQYMGVSKNKGTPKSWILIGFSIINHPFRGTPIVGNTHILLYDDYPWSHCHVLYQGMRYHNGPLLDIPKAQIKHQTVASIMAVRSTELETIQSDLSQAPGFFCSTTQPNGPRGGQSSHATRTEEWLIHLQIASCKMSGSLCWLVESLQENNVSKLHNMT